MSNSIRGGGGFDSYNSSNTYSRSKNPFGADDDDDDFSFGNRGGAKNDFNSNTNSNKERLESMQERIGYVEDQSLESTRRALRMINETQQVGSDTAQELYRQGEKLQSMETKIDEVNDTLTQTQKNLNQIKSIFGGLKNKFMGRSTSRDDFKKIESESKKSMSSSASSQALQKSPQQRAEHAVITGSDREKELNSNLDAMSMGLGNLKSLAMDMQLELDRQDPLIGRLQGKIEKTHDKVQDQNAQMRKILK